MIPTVRTEIARAHKAPETLTTLMASIVRKSPRIDRDQLVDDLFDITEKKGNTSLRYEAIKLVVALNFARLTRTAESPSARKRKAAADRRSIGKSVAKTIASAKATAREQLLDRVMSNGKKVRELGKRDAAKYGREHSGFGAMLTKAGEALKYGEVIGGRFNETTFRKLAKTS